MQLQLALLIFGIICISVKGDLQNLTCYNCIVTGAPGHDPSCLTNITTVDEIPCPEGYCTVQKIVTKSDPAGTFWSFQRMCHKEKPIYTDEPIEDSERITYHQCCRTPNCNIGDGEQHLGKDCSAAGHILVNSAMVLGSSLLLAFRSISQL